MVLLVRELLMAHQRERMGGGGGGGKHFPSAGLSVKEILPPVRVLSSQPSTAGGDNNNSLPSICLWPSP